MTIDFTDIGNNIMSEYGLAIFILCIVAAGLGFMFFMRYKSDIKMREKEQEARSEYQGLLVRQQEEMSIRHAENDRITQEALAEAVKIMATVSETMNSLDKDIKAFIHNDTLATAEAKLAMFEIRKDLPKHATDCSLLNHNIKDILVEIRTEIKTCNQLLITKK